MKNNILNHYCSIWNKIPTIKKWDKGPTNDLPADFVVLEFPPTTKRSMWTYATCGMSIGIDDFMLELHLFSPIQTDSHTELLASIAHYHRTSHPLGLGHTVNFGRPWLPSSTCEFGIISLPYLDGPRLEDLRMETTNKILKCLWLIPITKNERDYKINYGLESLENKFEENKFNYIDPSRSSVV